VVDGNPIKIDGNSDDGTDGTYAFAVNSNLTSTTSVPPVTGLSLDPSTGQGSAADALRNAGLVTGHVGSIYDGHPAGTVLQQEAVGYTVEPAGSPVNLVVSLGPPATVSDVIDFDPTSAGNAIREDGLVPDFRRTGASRAGRTGMRARRWRRWLAGPGTAA
jgi:beta-lactam-binding protein with PASTA domain